MIRVYHNVKAVSAKTYLSFFNHKFIAVPENQLIFVAEVRTNDLQVAFRLTNTKEKDWWTYEGVSQQFSGSYCRSTSVGDVLELNGTYYAIAPFGFAVVEVASS